MDKKHLLIVLFALVFTSIVAIGLRVPFLNIASFFRTDSSDAQQACFVHTFSITSQPVGHIFSQECVRDGGQIYSNDQRFTFYDVGGGVLPRGFTYVKTDDVAAKNDPNLHWSITLQQDSTIYVYFRRKIAVTQPPSWINDTFTSNTAQTPIDILSLNHYLLRKSTTNPKVGAYDAYFAQRSAGSVINFGPAYDANSKALSMYIVAVLPDIITSAPTASPVPTNSRTAAPSQTATATQSPVPSSTITVTRSPAPTATPAPTGDNASPGTTAVPNARETSVYLQTQNGSGQSGYAIITEMSATQTRVSLSLFGGNYTNQPAHIHSGTCANPGGVIYPLNNVTGTSITYLNVPYATVVGNLGIVNIHKSVAESAVYTACGAK